MQVRPEGADEGSVVSFAAENKRRDVGTSSCDPQLA